MLLYLFYRVVGIIPVVLGVTILVFFMVRLVPGDPVDVLSAAGREPTAEQREIMRRQLGLDKPIWEQYVSFMGGLVRGDLGNSFRSGRPVTQEIRLRLTNTLKLTTASFLVAVTLGVVIGVLAATFKGSWIDLGSMFAASISVSIPGFWFGLMLILLFSLQLGWLPAFGADSWKNLVLPVAALALRSTAVLARITRSTMLDILNQDFVRTARAKGLRESVVVFRHGLRNALIPIVTILGFEIGGLIGGAFIIEAVFAYPGMGQLGVQAILNRDFPLIQGIVLLASLSYVLANLFVDLLYGVLDPRVRYS